MLYPLSNVLPEPIDTRDFLASVPATLSLPDNVDLRKYAGDIEDQLTTGSCVANATASLLELLLERGGKFTHLSRLQLYWDIRDLYESLRGKDGGAYLSDALKSANKLGIAPESLWAFDVSKVNVKPPESVYTAALERKVARYERVAQFKTAASDAYQILRIQSMLAMGYPVSISMAVSPAIFEMTGSLLNATCQYTPLMTTKKLGSAGGHAMLVVGYITIAGLKWFIVENSWGTGYGDKGYLLIHPDALIADGWDAWTCTEFAGVVIKPDWSYQPEPPLTVSIPASDKIHYLKSYEDRFITGDPMTASISGGGCSI